MKRRQQLEYKLESITNIVDLYPYIYELLLLLPVSDIADADNLHFFLFSSLIFIIGTFHSYFCSYGILLRNYIDCVWRQRQ